MLTMMISCSHWGGVSRGNAFQRESRSESSELGLANWYELSKSMTLQVVTVPQSRLLGYWDLQPTGAEKE